LVWKSKPNRELKPDRGLRPVHELKCPSVSRNGFTLIEIVVALCIVAILSAIAIPGFKKATEDFRLNSTLEDTLDIMKACRAYYLIFNEWPADTNCDDIPDRLLPFVPRHLINPERGRGDLDHSWNCKPLWNQSYCYDIDNWDGRTVAVTLLGIGEGADWDKIYYKLRSIIGERYVLQAYYGGMWCLFPDCPGSIDLKADITCENRYY
jgi:prepilin-type N-terminal cleavage/methylation domain-containing protein